MARPGSHGRETESYASLTPEGPGVSRESRGCLTETPRRISDLPARESHDVSRPGAGVSESHAPLHAHVRHETPVLPYWMPPRSTCHPGCPWLDLAAGLVGLGYAPIPLGAEKRPLVKWGAYHVTPPTWRMLYNDWLPIWSDAHGIGLVTGRPHGLVVVDADDAESWAWALENLPAVRGVRTRRGGHLHFAHPPRGIIGNRSGNRAVTPAPGVRLDVKGLAGMATGPYSAHPSGHVYEPLGDWTPPVSDLPVLPDVMVRQAEDRPPRPSPPPAPRRKDTDPEWALEAYLRKAGGIPEEGAGSDEAVFRVASWCKANVPDLTERAFVAAIRRERPGFGEAWIASKWRSARGRA
jgi:hypothetical protein